MLRPDIRANDARANHCSVKNESGRVAPLPWAGGCSSWPTPYFTIKEYVIPIIKKSYTHSCEKKVVCTIEIPWVPTMGTPLFLRNYCFLHILALILILSHTGYSGRKASMSRRANEGSLFVGRLSKSTRVRDLEDIFEPYGRMTRCEIKYGNINN